MMELLEVYLSLLDVYEAYELLRNLFVLRRDF